MISTLAAQFDALMNALQQVRSAILSKQPAHTLPLTATEKTLGLQSLQVLADLITDVWYRDGQDGRETRSRHGLLTTDDELLQLIRNANEQKDLFRAEVQKVQAELDKAGFDEALGSLGARHAGLRESLHFSGLSRLHLKQCYRHLPLLEQPPLKVGFSWYAHGRSIRRISHAEAEQKLLALGEDKTHIQIQLTRLGSLSPADALAQVQTLAPVVRANIVYADDAPRKRQAMNAPLPLVIPGNVLPAFNEISPEPPEQRTRQRRGDQKISDEAYLPSIRAHIYYG